MKMVSDGCRELRRAGRGVQWATSLRVLIYVLCAFVVVPPARADEVADLKSADYLAAEAVDLRALLGDPPAADSATTRVEIAELLLRQEARTPEQVARAQAQEKLTVYAFAPVLGAQFNATNLPVTDKFLNRVGSNSSRISGGAKKIWKRSRPFQVDPRIQPVVKTQSPSYPSGHAVRGYVWAVVLGELFPDRKELLLARAREIGEDRMVAGVHYPSDIEAGRKLGLAIAEKMLASPMFQQDLAAARREVAAAPGNSAKLP